jgi:hypothetical protein
MITVDQKELEELLSCLWTDARLALDDIWDRDDSGFEFQRMLIEKFASKYDLNIKDVVKEERSVIVRPVNDYLIKILGIVAYMPVDRYIQWASKGPKGRFYVDRGAAGGLSISEKRVIILAQKISYYQNDKWLNIDPL